MNSSSFVQEIVIAGFGGHPLIVVECLAQHAAGLSHLLQEVDHAARPADLRAYRRAVAEAEEHRVAHNLFGLPARIRVVTDIGHTGR